MKNLIYSLILNKNFINKFLAFITIIILLVLLKDFLIIFIITFLVGYLTYSLGTYINHGLINFVDSNLTNQKIKKFFYFIFNKNFIITLIYLILIGLLVLFITRYLPRIFFELKKIFERIPFMQQYANDYVSQIEEVIRLKKDIQGELGRFATEQNINILIKIFNSLKSIGTFLMQGILIVILSYFFVIERKQLSKYFCSTNIGFLASIYQEITIIFRKIGKWFGVIFRAQAIISFTNTILTALGLTLIGYLHGGFFPYLLTLCTFVFIFGFIPVLGTFLSSIPIVIIGFMLGGMQTAIYCVGLIIFIHALETYVLNPQILGSYTHLPAAMTFLILIISEHFFGPIGLLIGIPTFFIIMDTFIDIDKWLLKRNEKKEFIQIEEEIRTTDK